MASGAQANAHQMLAFGNQAEGIVEGSDTVGLAHGNAKPLTDQDQCVLGQKMITILNVLQDSYQRSIRTVSMAVQDNVLNLVHKKGPIGIHFAPHVADASLGPRVQSQTDGTNHRTAPHCEVYHKSREKLIERG